MLSKRSLSIIAIIIAVIAAPAALRFFARDDSPLAREAVRAAAQGKWGSFGVELQPAIAPDGSVRPNYVTREVEIRGDSIGFLITHFADPLGAARFFVTESKGTMVWSGRSPLIDGCHNVDIVFNQTLAFTAHHPLAVEILAQMIPAAQPSIGRRIDILRMAIPAYGLEEGGFIEDFELICIRGGRMHMSARPVDGSELDRPEKRSGHVSIALQRR